LSTGYADDPKYSYLMVNTNITQSVCSLEVPDVLIRKSGVYLGTLTGHKDFRPAKPQHGTQPAYTHRMAVFTAT
jgi:hypothetical protein